MNRIAAIFGLISMWVLPVWTARADILISEVLSDNENGIRDEDGDREDWIELYNDGNTDVPLYGWWLTDKANNPTQWRFPAVTIPAQGTLLVWASGKNRTNPSKPLHTSFSLSKSGEYLGLYKPDPDTGLPVLADHYSPQFPALPPDISYGYTSESTIVPLEPHLIPFASTARYRVIKRTTEGAAFYTGTDYAAGHVGHDHDDGWNVSPAFDDSAWTEALLPIGFNTTATPYGTNIRADLYNINTSLLLRKTFTVADRSTLAALILKVRYEDAFVAFINGVEVSRANYTPAALTWNALSSVTITTFTTPPEKEVMLTDLSEFLVEGENVLAIQGLNISLTSSDFYLDAELTAVDIHRTYTPAYFAEPTPGDDNGIGAASVLLFNPTPADPDIPRPLGNAQSPPLVVTVQAVPTAKPIASVTVHHRTMWAVAVPVAMRDDGVAPDAVAGDGIYSAEIPTSMLTTGQMFRWRFEAADTAGTVTKFPPYYTTLSDSARYFGTVALDASTGTSQLPVLEWFVESSPANGPTAATFRGSCLFKSNFYDNVEQSLHGQTTRGFIKKSYNFNFTKENRFLWRDGERRIKKVNLLTNLGDKTKTRNTFSHWVGELAGAAAHFCLPVRVQLNGKFHGVMDLMEKGDDRMLERNGLDPDGALYKIYNVNITTSAEKKTRKTETNADLTALATGIRTALPIATRQTYFYDNLDVATTINYLATRFINSDTDHGYKNYYLYRDTNGNGEWMPLIWDVDLSQGHCYIGGYFNDTLVTDTQFVTLLSLGENNPVYRVIFYSPELRQMFMRRFRTLMDTLLQPPGTTDGLFETRMREIVATVDPDPAVSTWTDGDLDAIKWGIPFTTKNRPREEVERVIANYFGPRRTYLYDTGTKRAKYNGEPIPDNAQTNAPGMVAVHSLDFLPAGGTQAEEYVILSNTTAHAVDLSGWTVTGQINHTFKPGTVIPSGAGTAAANYVGLLHLAKDAKAFRARATGPTGGQRRLIQDGYSGQLSARGGTVNLRDPTGLLISSLTYAGDPTPAQRQLRITEIQYHPAPLTAAEKALLGNISPEEFEYIELLNLGPDLLDLTGAYFSAGITFTFPPVFLDPGQRIILAKNPTAFGLRYPDATATVFGPYDGQLDNSGEQLELRDAVGEKVFDFEYKDGWYPHTDGSGRSLVIRDPAPEQDLGKAVAWGISHAPLGSPGAASPRIAQAYYGWDNFHFTSLQRDNPAISAPSADPDGDGIPNWVEYALGLDPWQPDPALPLTLTFASDTAPGTPFAFSFQRIPDLLDIRHDILATGDLQWELWSEVKNTVEETIPRGDGRETVILREATPPAADRRFYKLRMQYTP